MAIPKIRKGLKENSLLTGTPPMADDRVAQIKIETIDDTGKGLEGATANFKHFDEQLKNLEKNLNPIQKLLDGGLVVSTSVSGLASLGKTSGNLSAAMGDLKKNLLGISGPASEAAEALGGYGKICDFIAKRASELTVFFTTVRAGIEIGKKAISAVEAAKTIHLEYKNVLLAAKLEAQSANAVEAASVAVNGASGNRLPEK